MTPKQRCVQALVQLMGDDLVRARQRARQRAARMTPAQLEAPYNGADTYLDYIRSLEDYEAEIRAAIAWVNSKED